MIITNFILTFVFINKFNNDRVMITREEFKRLAGIEIRDEHINIECLDNLNLLYREEIKDLPDNLKVIGYTDLRYSGITKLPKGLEVNFWLDISGTEIEELPEDIKFGGYFCVNNMKRPFSFPKIVKTEDSFICTRTTIKRMPEELYVKGSCDLSKSTFDKLPKVMEVGESLILQSTPITELPEGLKEVYGNLDISNTKITKLNDNLVVYEHLKFVNTLIEELPEGLIVGNFLYLYNTNLYDYSNLHKVCSKIFLYKWKYEEIKDILPKHSKDKLWVNSDKMVVTFKPNYKGAYLFENEYGKYIKADEIFGKIVEQKGNVYHINVYGTEEITYLVTDGEGRWSHGKTLEEAKDDLLYKISNRRKRKSKYKNLSLDSELSFEDAIVCYRVITGACSFGTRNFIENRLGENKKEVYTIKEIIDLTEGEYGNKIFREFFCKS